MPDDVLRVILEVGPKRRVVAAAMDWPGLDRWGVREDAAVERLLTYLPRYAGVAERAGRGAEFGRAHAVQIVERTPGSSSTDFWGIAHVPSAVEHEALSSAELERRLELLQAAWERFEATAARMPVTLRPGARGGGRDRDTIVGHVHVTEDDVFARKVGFRTPRAELLTAPGVAAHRARFLAVIRAHHAEGRMARRWPLAFLIRRTAQHALDHAWEMEDRDPRAAAGPAGG